MAPIDPTEVRSSLPSPVHGDSALDRAAIALARRERTLWIVAALALAADVLTTLAGLQAGLAEGNPVVASALADAGLAGFLVVKVAVFVLAVGVRVAMPRFRVAIPLGVALPWIAATATNVYLLAAVA